MRIGDAFDFAEIGSGLPATALESLVRDGFTVVPGPCADAHLPKLIEAYDRAVREADPADTKHGSTTIRVDDLVNRGPEFDGIYVYAPLLEACRRVFQQPFKLSTMLARTLRAGAAPQKLHQDFACDVSGWSMVGFILAIDDFRAENGATCFLPGSHQWTSSPSEDAVRKGLVPACGAAGSIIIYNGSVWHGHGSNTTSLPRRSIQGAFIRRDLTSGFDLASRMRPETLARIDSVAKRLIYG